MGNTRLNYQFDHHLAGSIYPPLVQWIGWQWQFLIYYSRLVLAYIYPAPRLTILLFLI